MEKTQNNQRKAGKYMAYSGIVAACAVAMMLLGSYITAAAYVCTAAASFLIYTILEECNLRYALVGYVCVSILSVLFVPYKRIVWMFVLLVGYYPLLKQWLDGLKSKLLKLVLKLLLCDGTMAVLFYATAEMFYTGQLLPEFAEFAQWSALAFILLGNVAFLCYDFALGKILKFYRQMISPRLKKAIGFPVDT